MKTKNLSMVLGSLMALNSAGFMSAGAVTEEQKNTKKYSVESLLDNVDTKTVQHIGLGAAVVGSLWALKEIVTTRKDNTTLRLTPTQKKIYDATKKLSDMILNYVADYIKNTATMPEEDLEASNPDQQKILQQVKSIRQDWLNMYDNHDEQALSETTLQGILNNERLNVSDGHIWPVRLTAEAIENLFYGLPVGQTQMTDFCAPRSPSDCNNDMDFLKLLWKLDSNFRWEYLKLANDGENPGKRNKHLTGYFTF